MNKVLIILTLLLCCFANRATAAIIYVDSTNTMGAQDGTSWATAFTSPRQAIITAVSGDSVWIAKGTYLIPQAFPINMKQGVKVFGGFLNIHSSFPQRDWQAYPTILKGNGRIVNNTDNNLNASSVLDGCVITNGLASKGGAIYNSSTSPTFRNCVFTGNKSTAGTGAGGGAMYNEDNANPTIINCTFSNNTVDRTAINDFGESFGGAIYNDYSSPTITNCIFTQNAALGDNVSGGAIYNFHASPLITNCTLTNNSAVSTNNGSYGGAVYNQTSSPVMSNCVVSDNFLIGDGHLIMAGPVYGDTYGAGICNNGSGNPVFSNCTFSGNRCYTDVYSRGFGGAIASLSGAVATFTDCVFTNNKAGTSGSAIYSFASMNVNRCNFSANRKSNYGGAIFCSGTVTTIKNSKFIADSAQNGGAIYTRNSSPTIINCVFSGNVADSFGAAFTSSNGTGKIVNCTFFNNKADINGSGVYSTNNSSLTIRNTVMWGNFSGIFTDGTAVTASSYSLIQGYSANSMLHNLAGTTDPLFLDVANNNFQLTDPSPCIDAGDNAAYTSAGGNLMGDFDLAGNARLSGSAIDIGAHEFNNTPLSITDLNFKGTLQQNNATVLLTWNDAGPTQVDYFELYRSHDAKNFYRVTSIAGSQTAEENSYSVMDNVEQPSNFYRLKIIYADGQNRCSNTLQVNLLPSTAKISLSPNPAKESVTLKLRDEGMLNSELGIYDINGRFLRRTTIITRNQMISVTDFKKGIYYFRIGGDTYTIIKE